MGFHFERCKRKVKDYRTDMQDFTETGALRFLYRLHLISNKCVQMPHWIDDEDCGNHRNKYAGQRESIDMLQDGRSSPFLCSDDEWRRSREMSQPTSKWIFLVIIVYSIYVAKNVIYLPILNTIIGKKSHKFDNFETVPCANFSSTRQSHLRVKQLDCLQISCTDNRYSPEKDFQLMQVLPIYLFCDKFIEQIFPPTLSHYPVGVVETCWITFWAFVGSVLVPIYGMLKPLKHKIMSDIYCPMRGIALAREKQARYLAHLGESFENFRFNHEKRIFRDHLQASSFVHGYDLMPTIDPQENQKHRKSKLEQARADLRRMGFCIPIEFTEWWRAKFSTQYLYHVLMYSCVTILVPLMIHLQDLYLTWRGETLLLDKFERHNCFLRAPRDLELVDKVAGYGCAFDDEEQLVWRSIGVDDCRHHWNTYTTLENVFQLMFTATTNAVLQTDLTFSVLLLQAKIFELSEQVEIAIQMAHLMLEKDFYKQSNILNSDKQFNSFAYVRNELFKNIDIKLMFVTRRRHKRFRHNKSIEKTSLEQSLAYREIAFNILKAQNFDEQKFLLFLEGIEVTSWSLIDSLRNINRPVERILVLDYFIVYGLSMISVLSYKVFNDRFIVSIFVNFIAIMILNGVISICSSVHKHSSKLKPKLCSLIAALAGHQGDLKIDHMRALFTKQAEDIDDKEGLALKLFGSINVTYLGIIELTLRTYSLLLLAYSHG